MLTKSSRYDCCEDNRLKNTIGKSNFQFACDCPIAGTAKAFAVVGSGLDTFTYNKNWLCWQAGAMALIHT